MTNVTILTFLSSTIPFSTVTSRYLLHGVYTSQLIRYSRACNSYQDCQHRSDLLTRTLLNQDFIEIKNIDTKQSNERNNQNSKSEKKTITWNKETQMTGQHEPLWKREVKPNALETRLRSTLKKYFGRNYHLTLPYRVPVTNMVNDICMP